MTTPSKATGVVGMLVEALEATAEWEGECGSCGNRLDVCDAENASEDPKFPGCPGPKARRALAAFQGRRPLREDPWFIAVVDRVEVGDFVSFESLADEVDAALLGSPAPQGPDEKCEACGGRGEQVEWVEAMPACVVTCHVCEGSGRRSKKGGTLMFTTKTGWPDCEICGSLVLPDDTCVNGCGMLDRYHTVRSEVKRLRGALLQIKRDAFHKAQCRASLCSPYCPVAAARAALAAPESRPAAVPAECRCAPRVNFDTPGSRFVVTHATDCPSAPATPRGEPDGK